MVTATINMTLFNRGMSGLLNVGVRMKPLVQKEAGELSKTLVNITPPDSPTKTRENIKSGISSKFALAGDSENSNLDRYSGTVGPAGIKWYQVDSEFLRGIAPEKDMRKASVEDLNKLRFSITAKGRQTLAFRHPRQRQRVLLYQTVLAKASTIRKLITRAQSHVGRLKAGWLVAVGAGVLKLTGSKPPQFVMRHIANARGSYINGLNNPKGPQFTITNSAVGIGQRNVLRLVQKAMDIRGKAMLNNARLIFKGKKTLASYAGGAA